MFILLIEAIWVLFIINILLPEFVNFLKVIFDEMKWVYSKITNIIKFFQYVDVCLHEKYFRLAWINLGIGLVGIVLLVWHQKDGMIPFFELSELWKLEALVTLLGWIFGLLFSWRHESTRPGRWSKI